jgi:hypothetical protein
MLVLLLSTWFRASASGLQPPVSCSTLADCRQLALDALASADYERAHDLAWRVIQTSPRRDHDPAALSLLARAQSLSGRGYDAFVALQRLAGMGVVVEDVETSDDFRRVREYPQWSTLLETVSAIRSKDAGAGPNASTGTPASAGRAAPVAPSGGGSAVASVAPVTAAPVAPGRFGAAEAAPLVRELALPSAVTRPTAMAYDAVSARFVIASGSSDSLHVLSESSGNATNLVRDGWSGNAAISAVAIDHRRGDLWVAGRSPDRASLHRLQLISGRLLETIAPPADAGKVDLVALATGADAIYALDGAGRRIFIASPKAAALRPFVQLGDVTPIGLASANGALYVAHARGLLRVDLSSRAIRPLTTAKGVDVSNLQSLAWHDGALLAVQQKGGQVRAVRLHVNAGGLAITSVGVLAETGETTAALSGEMYCYVTAGTDTPGVACRSLRKK